MSKSIPCKNICNDNNVIIPVRIGNPFFCAKKCPFVETDTNLQSKRKRPQYFCAYFNDNITKMHKGPIRLFSCIQEFKNEC